MAPMGKGLRIGLRYRHPSIRVHCAVSNGRPASQSLLCGDPLVIANARAVGYAACETNQRVKGALALPLI